MRRTIRATLPLLLAAALPLDAQEGVPLTPDLFEGLQLRAIGPALTTGRISDVAIDPGNRSVWYVGVSSGNVWKTVNRGTTWIPIFDDYGSYSIGAVTVDPLDPDIVWVGTGENASQRSAGWGDGIYKSSDAGASFTRMGLERSEHIGDILVDPRDSDVVYAASQGPLWASGGDRGLYKTTDGGETWTRVLHVSEDTGIADIVFDAFDPDVIYAASYQRRRHVGILIAGGPEGKIFRSMDAGASWSEIMTGIPAVDLGRVALEVSQHRPGVVYALVAAQGDESGFFRSEDYGSTWTRQSDHVVVDPQYYGELFADPNREGRLCAVDVVIHCTADDGVTFERLPLQGVHVDHHEIVFDAEDPDYMLIGNDGGIYETWDGAATWRHHGNLPITQFYRVGIDVRKPFYWVYGGTQDNGTQGGPSRTRSVQGIRNADWARILGGDGFQVRTDPRDPDIVFGMAQGARISRVNLRTGESVSIAPPAEAAPGDSTRWHWDIPLVVSHHDPDRLYALGSHLARSDAQGDDWRLVSPDLSKQIDRDTLEVMGRIWPDDAVWKHVFTNDYGIGVAFSESPFDEGLLYVGTDDGLVQVTEDGGQTWRRIDAFPGVPEMIYVSDVVASRHHSDRVYALFNNHKRGDFGPYALRSDDRGRTWTSIAGDLPENHAAWVLVEDPEREELLFLGTELALFFTVTGGDSWIELTGGAPTIPYRDLEIHEGEVDLVAATFGRGFMVLDDYSALRHVAANGLGTEPVIFPPPPAELFIQTSFYTAGSGNANYVAPNPPFGATITYYLPQAAEGDGTEVLLVVRDAAGELVNEVTAPNRAGLSRVTWNLRYPPPEDEEGRRRGRGRLVEAGTFSVSLETRTGDASRVLVPPVGVDVVTLPLG